MNIVEKKLKVFVTGATGFVGQRLVDRLVREGHTVVCLTRNPERAMNLLGDQVVVVGEEEYFISPGKWMYQVDALVHLAGEPISQRWTAKTREKIIWSRVDFTEKLLRVCETVYRGLPKVVITASAVGYYGDRGDETLTEKSKPGEGFLADVCHDWEWKGQCLGIVRSVQLRLGIVLGNGGALKKMLTPFKLGLGGRIGSGEQWMPWIHVDDVVEIIIESIQNQNIEGPVNCVSPIPITNATFTKTLGRVLRKPTVFPVPATLLKLLFGDMSQVLLASQKVWPSKLKSIDFDYKFPRLGSALVSVIRES